VSETRVCNTCAAEKPLDEFPVANKPQYRKRRCAECHNAHRRALFQKKYHGDDEFKKRYMERKDCYRKSHPIKEVTRKKNILRQKEWLKNKLKSDDEFRKKYNLSGNLRQRKKIKEDVAYRDEYNRKKRDYLRKRWATDQVFRQVSLSRRRADRENLSASYINSLFGRNLANSLPQELVEVKRLQLKIKRLVKDSDEKHN
jgi:hypothetical protein